MEREFVEWLTRELPSPASLKIGIGDDAAVLDWCGRGDCVATTDMLMDGVDFRLAETSPRRVGRKALAVNLSDLAAMAARPVAALVSVALPRQGGLALAKELVAGMRPLADEFSTCLAGGDTNSWEGPLVISLTALGETAGRPPLTRSGGRPGDVVLATGEFGGSLARKHFDFVPRVREALYLAERYELHAGMDVSDGLSLDLARLCAASGCGAELNLSAIPISPDAWELAARDGSARTPLERALSDGEDFELLLTAAPREADRMLRDAGLGVKLTAIGTLSDAQGLWQISSGGERLPLVPRGYEHILE